MSLRVGLIGATGLIGRSLLEQMLADDAVSGVRVFARRGGLSDEPKLDWQTLDFDHFAEEADLDGLGSLCCCLGTTTGKAGKAGLEKVDRDYVLAAARAAHAAGIDSFAVISSLGANPKSLVHYSRVKGQMEAGLREIGFGHLDIFRPSLLLGDRPESRLGEDIGKAMAPALNALLPGKLKRYRAIPASAVASAMLARVKQAEPGTHIRFLPA